MGRSAIATAMQYGLQKTESALAEARNRAVLPVLTVALQSTSATVRATAIRATIRRHDLDSHTQLIRLFHTFTATDRVALQEAHQSMPHHAAPALKAAVLNADPALCCNACDMILACHDYQLFPALVTALEKSNGTIADRISATIHKLSIELHDSVIDWTNGERIGLDPSFARHHVIATLERSLKRKAGRHASALVDAFLLLAPSDNQELLAMMRDCRHACHAQLVAELASNGTPATMERLLALFRDTDAPQAALEAIGCRQDRPFLDYLLHELKQPVALRVLNNMKRLRTVVWLEDQRKMLLEFDGHAQAIAVSLAMASEIDRGALFELLQMLLQHGLNEGRRASCLALAAFGEEANELIVVALDDPDAGVQAAAVRQLRPRRIPEALQILVAKLESQFAEVRDAACSSLAEFNFVRYRAMFDLLDEQSARTTGALVRQVDHSVRDNLMEDLTSPSVTTRLRGIEMAVAMGAAMDVREQLISLARHENAAIRKEAVMALAYAAGPDVTEVLDLAVRDTNRSVSDAARKSLATLRFSNNEPYAATVPEAPNR